VGGRVHFPRKTDFGSMSSVIWHNTISLEGFIAGLNERLFSGV
jgi:hypothetical protein